MKSLGVGPLILGFAALAACANSTGSEPSATTSEALEDPIRDGEHNFTHHVPTGNGRACATCHVEAEFLTLTPAHVEKAFQAMLDGNDEGGNPLFRAIDADDPNCDDGRGEGESDGKPECTFNRLRQGLVRVTLDLPANVTVDGDPSIRSVSVWRSVPTVNNVAFTAPYLLDGRAATLQEQALGATLGHIQPRDVPDAPFFDAIAAYEKDQFSSDRTRQLAATLAAGGTGTRAEPGDLTSEESAGQAAFNFRCANCHGGPSMTIGRAQGGGHFKEIGISMFNNTGLPTHRYAITKPDGTVVTKVSPDPGRMLITGAAGDFERFDTPTIYGIADTAPYFHDNSAATLEDVLLHYQRDFAFLREFGPPFLRTGSTDPRAQTVSAMTDTEMANIIAYMKRL